MKVPARKERIHVSEKIEKHILLTPGNGLESNIGNPVVCVNHVHPLISQGNL